MRCFHWIKHEIRLQQLNGLYALYMIVSLIYIFLLGYVPENYINLALVVVIASDPTMMGMIFVGGFILLEKNSGVNKGIGVSPLGEKAYILGKTISLLIISLLTSFFIVITYKGFTFNMLLLFIVISLSSVLFTMIGIIGSSIVNTMNQYIALIILVGVFTVFPVINFFGYDLKILDIFPINNLLILINGAITNSTIHMSNVLILILWIIVILFVCEGVVKNRIFKG